VQRETVWQGRIVTLEIVDDFYEVARHAPAVAILAVRPGDGYVLGVEQPRPAINAVTWELPAGLIDPGEQPEQAAARELREEASLCGRLTFITRSFASPGFTDEEAFLFEAHDLVPCDGSPDPGEELHVAWRDPNEIWRNVADGTLATSSLTLLGIRHVLARQPERS